MNKQEEKNYKFFHTLNSEKYSVEDNYSKPGSGSTRSKPIVMLKKKILKNNNRFQFINDFLDPTFCGVLKNKYTTSG